MQKTKEEEFKEKVFFKGQIWDSYELIIDIIKQAKKKIVIIDNYVDDTILKMLQKKNKNVEVTLFTSKNSNLTNLKDLGKKCFAINKIEEEKFVKDIMKLVI